MKIQKNKKICIVTTSEEDFFTPHFLNYCLASKKFEFEIVLLPGFFNIKKILYLLLLLNFKEIFEIIFFKLFKKKISYDCKTYNFDSINIYKFHNFVNKKKFDLILSYNCNQIFTEKTLNKIKCNIVNFHPGLLPKYRGLFTNFYSLKNKEKYVGITFHVINKKIDNGRILKKFKIKVNKNDTVFRLYKKIFLEKNSHKFMLKCITNYRKLLKLKNKNHKYYRYNSYPKIVDIISFKFN